MKTRLEEATDRAMIMATHLFPYDGKPVREWFKTLPFADRVKAFHVAHEMTKYRFSGSDMDDQNRFDEVVAYFERDQEELVHQVCSLIPPDRCDELRGRLRTR